MWQAGQTFSYRKGMTEKIVAAYLKILAKHNAGEIMYRDRQTKIKQKQTKANNKDWYRQLGYDTTVAVQTSEQGQLTDKIKTAIKDSKYKVKLIDKPGQTVGQTLRRSNPFPRQICDRQNCVLCRQNEKTDNRCYKSNFGYIYVCNRSPCSDNLNMKKLKTEELRQQLEDRKTDKRAAIYEGQSYRSVFLQSKLHADSYKTKDRKDS